MSPSTSSYYNNSNNKKAMKNTTVSPTSVVSGHVCVNKNDKIPGPKFDNADDVSPTQQLGRGIYYEPKIVYTPVLASRRLFAGTEAGTSSTTHHLDRAGVDELNKKFEALLIGDGNCSKDQRKPDESTVKTSTTQRPKTMEDDEGVDESPASDATSGAAPAVAGGILGRITSTFFSSKTQTSQKVTRSARLASS